MKLAMEEDNIVVQEGNAPFACLVIDRKGTIIMREHDRVLEQMDPTAHAEINAIRRLCKQLHSLSLKNYIFYTTSEPCPTCMTSMIKAHVSQVVHGAKTETTASLPIPAEVIASQSHKYPIHVTGGILSSECLEQRETFSGN